MENQKNLSFSETTWKVGHNDVDAFPKLFKSETGLTPNRISFKIFDRLILSNFQQPHRGSHRGGFFAGDYEQIRVSYSLAHTLSDIINAMGSVEKKNKHSNILFWMSLVLLVGLVASYFIFPGFKHGVDEAYNVITSEDNDRIRTWVKQFGALGPLILILAMTAQMFLFVIPNLLLFIIAILCYGPIWGSLICLGGVFISSSFGYLIGKKLGPRAIDRFVSEKAQERISGFVNLYGAKAVAILRLSSLASDGLGFVAGILEMEYKKFILATMSGIFPVVLLIAIFGNNGKIETALIWLAAISVAAFVVYIIVDKKRRRPHLIRT